MTTENLTPELKAKFEAIIKAYDNHVGPHYQHEDVLEMLLQAYELDRPTGSWMEYAKRCIRDVENERDRRDAEYRADKDHYG